MRDAYPLAWPDDEPRTRPQDREDQKAWKKNLNDSKRQLEREVLRMGGIGLVVSTNIPVKTSGILDAGMEPLDPGVAIYFSRTVKLDFGWQDALNIHVPAPTLELVKHAYQELSKKYHPDNQATGDKEMFHVLTKHRDNAVAYIQRRDGFANDYAIACDKFKQVRWNITALRLTLAAIRQLERCGTSSMLERAFKGFEQIEDSHVDKTAN